MSKTSPKPRVPLDVVGAFGYAVAIAAMFNAVLVIAKESNPVVMKGLAALTGHHWTGHGLLVLLTFVCFGWLLAWPLPTGARTQSLALFLASAVVASSAIILITFLVRAAL